MTKDISGINEEVKNINAVVLADIFNSESFKEELLVNSKLEGYYHGNTSNGFYNDTTGKAYLVKYAEDGTVRYIYHGNLKDGVPDDNTGDAWDIAKEINTEYMYYKGLFQNGNAKKDMDPDHEFVNPISIERIEQIIAENNTREHVACELVWHK